MTTAPDLLSELPAVVWLADRLQYDRRVLYAKIVAGTTDAPMRKARAASLIREAIGLKRCAHKTLGKNPHTQQPETFAEAFERLFLEKL